MNEINNEQQEEYEEQLLSVKDEELGQQNHAENNDETAAGEMGSTVRVSVEDTQKSNDARPQKSAPSNPTKLEKAEIRMVKISEIANLHPAIEDLRKDISAAPFRQVPLKLIRPELIQDLLKTFPIRIMSNKNRWYCAGNIRLFQFAKEVFAHDTYVPCIVPASRGQRKLKEQVLHEIMYSPIFLGAHFSDIPILVEIARRAIKIGMIPSTDRPIETELAELYGVDVRRLKPTKEDKKSSEERAQNDANNL